MSMGKTAQPVDHPQLPADDPIWLLLRRCWAVEEDTRPTMDEVVAEVSVDFSGVCALLAHYAYSVGASNLFASLSSTSGVPQLLIEEIYQPLTLP